MTARQRQSDSTDDDQRRAARGAAYTSGLDLDQHRATRRSADEAASHLVEQVVPRTLGTTYVATGDERALAVQVTRCKAADTWQGATHGVGAPHDGNDASDARVEVYTKPVPAWDAVPADWDPTADVEATSAVISADALEGDWDALPDDPTWRRPR